MQARMSTAFLLLIPGETLYFWRTLCQLLPQTVGDLRHHGRRLNFGPVMDGTSPLFRFRLVCGDGLSDACWSHQETQVLDCRAVSEAIPIEPLILLCQYS